MGYEGEKAPSEKHEAEVEALRAEVASLKEKNASLLRGAQRMRCPEHEMDASNAWGCPGCVADMRTALRAKDEQIKALTDENRVLRERAERFRDMAQMVHDAFRRDDAAAMRAFGNNAAGHIAGQLLLRTQPEPEAKK